MEPTITPNIVNIGSELKCISSLFPINSPAKISIANSEPITINLIHKVFFPNFILTLRILSLF